MGYAVFTVGIERKGMASAMPHESWAGMRLQPLRAEPQGLKPMFLEPLAAWLNPAGRDLTISLL